jgi:hypothetical protein
MGFGLSHYPGQSLEGTWENIAFNTRGGAGNLPYMTIGFEDV